MGQIPPIAVIPESSSQEIKSLTRRIWANTAHRRHPWKFKSEKQVAHAADLGKYRPSPPSLEAYIRKASRSRGGSGQIPPIFFIARRLAWAVFASNCLPCDLFFISELRSFMDMGGICSSGPEKVFFLPTVPFFAPFECAVDGRALVFKAGSPIPVCL